MITISGDDPDEYHGTMLHVLLYDNLYPLAWKYFSSEYESRVSDYQSVRQDRTLTYRVREDCERKEILASD